MQSRRANHQVECLKRRLLAREAEIQKELKATKDLKIRPFLRTLAALMRLDINHIGNYADRSIPDSINEMLQSDCRRAEVALADVRKIRQLQNRIAKRAGK